MFNKEFYEKYPQITNSSIQVFHDKIKGSKEARKLQFTQENLNGCVTMNARGLGIFFSANAMQKGERSKKTTTGIKAWICESDDLSKQEQMDIISSCPLPPSAIVESKKSYHMYWFAKDGDFETYETINRGLAQYFQGDQKICSDRARVLRLPGYYHKKSPDAPFMVDCIHIDDSYYTKEDMIKAYPRSQEDKKNDVQDNSGGGTLPAHRPSGTYNDKGGVDGDCSIVRFAKTWNAKEMLTQIEGSQLVNGDTFQFVKNGNGTEQISVNGKPTGCWIDSSGMIGSSGKGGPTRVNRVRRYNNRSSDFLEDWIYDNCKNRLSIEAIGRYEHKRGLKKTEIKQERNIQAKRKIEEQKESDIEEAEHMWINEDVDISYDPKTAVTWGIDDVDESLKRITLQDLVVLVAYPAMGKCVDPNTQLLMSDGTQKKAKDLLVGDLLMGPDSKSRRVLRTCKGKETMYRISTREGHSWIVNESHGIWLYGAKYRHKGKTKLENVKDFYEKSKHYKEVRKMKKVGYDLPEKNFNIDPYNLGLRLGDGDTDLIDISGKEIEELYDKYIPEEYFSGSREQRLSLLAGIIDNYGRKESESSYNILQECNTITKDIKRLCDTLGFKITVTRIRTGYNSFRAPRSHNRIVISGRVNEIPLLVERKKTKGLVSKKDHSLYTITIEKLNYGDYCGFEVDKDHLYLTPDGFVHHNTQFGLFMAQENGKKQLKSTFFSLELSKEVLFERTAVEHAEIDWNDWLDAKYTKGEKTMVEEKIKELNNIENVNIVSATKSVTLGLLLAGIRKFHKEGSKIFFIDNLGKIVGDGRESENTRFERITSELQNIMKELDICIILMHHLGKPEKGSEYLPGGGSAFRGTQKIKDNCTCMVEIRYDRSEKTTDAQRSSVQLIQYKRTRAGGADRVGMMRYYNGSYYNDRDYHMINSSLAHSVENKYNENDF